ncbi:MAG: hypothetical protein AB7S80_10330 [Rhizobiaceae bacterium]
MSRLARFALIALAAAAAGMFSASTASAGADKEVASCHDSAVLARIVSKFRHQVTYVPNLPDVDIVDFRKIHERRYLPYRESRPIARRYCGATAHLSDGKKRSVWYLIEDRMGFASIGDGVEFCVSGFDRWRVYNGRCRVVK